VRRGCGAGLAACAVRPMSRLAVCMGMVEMSVALACRAQRLAEVDVGKQAVFLAEQCHANGLLVVPSGADCIRPAP
jgi:hypothetical protein